MEIDIIIRSISAEELPKLANWLTTMRAQAKVNPDDVDDQNDRPDERESTRERGLKKFASWAQGVGLRVRRSSSVEHGTFIVTIGDTEWPVEVICSKRPRISLRKQWAEPKNLLIAYVWVEDDEVVIMRYKDVEAHLEDAAFTPEGFYTKALSPNRKQDLLRHDSVKAFIDSAVATLVETGSVGSEAEARDYIRDNGFPGTIR